MVPSTERVARSSRVMPTYAQFPFDQWAEARYRPGARKRASTGNIDRGAKSAAVDIVKVLVAMQDVNLEASESGDDSGEEASVARLRTLISSYNNLRDTLKEAGSNLNPSVRSRLEQQVEASEYERLGIRMKEDGDLELDEIAFRDKFTADEERIFEALNGSNGLPAALRDATARYIGNPVSELLNERIYNTNPKRTYPPRMQSGVRLYMKGILLDKVM